MIPQKFAKKLLDWHKLNGRKMPWAESKDPYKIWISEIILQQTRVAQGWHYFLRFIDKFPDIYALYKADESEVFSQWEGLGYYTRVKNIVKTSKIIVENFNGKFPDTYESLLSLPGIGPYTASAIVGFAYDLPYPVFDGNVIRLISRLKGISGSMSETKNQTEIKTFTREAIHTSTPSLFNQAIMNYGALVCKPVSPLCSECTLQKHCIAFATQKVDGIPTKKIKIVRLNRYFHYFLFFDPIDKTTLILKRENKDIWQNLYEFPLLESIKPEKFSRQEVQSQLKQKGWVIPELIDFEIQEQSQLLTHQKIHFTFYKWECDFSNIQYPANYTNIEIHKLPLLPMPIRLKKIIEWLNV